MYEVTDGCEVDEGYVGIGSLNADPVWNDMAFDYGEADVWDGVDAAMSNLEIGQLIATDGDGDPLTYSSDSSSFVSVQSNGSVRITNPSGFFSAIEAGIVQLKVYATDGIIATPIMNEIFLGKHNGWLDQTEIRIRTRAGDIIQPTTASGFIDILYSMRDNGTTITELIIKGHGGQTVQVGDNGEYLGAPDNGQNIFIGDDDVTDLLSDVTDGNTTIYLRGCFTHPLAQKVSARLDGAKVYGAIRAVIGIPGTVHAFGVYRQ